MDLKPYAELLAPFYDPPDALRWLNAPQVLLAGAVPVDLIRAGRQQEVLDVIARLRDAAYI